MDRSGEDQQPPLLEPASSDLFDKTINSSSTFVPSVLSSVHHRPGYQRITSAQQEEDISYKGPARHQGEEADGDSVHGLRINFPDHDEQSLTFGASVINRSTPNVPGSSSSYLSPESVRSLKQSRTGLSDSPEDDALSTLDRSSPSATFQPFIADDDREPLRRQRRSSTLQTVEPTDSAGAPVCRTKKPIVLGRRNWLSITILALSIYSTIFSGIWLGLAVSKPRYGKHITANGPFPPSTASLVCAAFAKSIELSFVTVFVSFLGQVLSQRAFAKEKNGVTIAQMQMRMWVEQPGTLVTHWETLRYAAVSFLGAITLTAAFISMVYTTASDALVSPKLRFGGIEQKLLYGQVKTIYGNDSYQIANCKTPMTNDTDPYHYGPTCMAIEDAGQAYHNYAQYLNNWDATTRLRNGSVLTPERPTPVGMLYDNTTVYGSWIHAEDMPSVSERYDRIVNNVTMAMPLTAVSAAVRDTVNGILQPQDLDGLGEYFVTASVPSPSLNVLCAEMSQEELSPMILMEWPRYKGTELNTSKYPVEYDIPRRPSWLNQTSVDDLFGFGEEHGRRHPVFSKLPLAHNTVFNNTDVAMESDSVYVLLTSPKETYMLCSIRSSMSPNCSTEYHAQTSGGTMTARCNDPNDHLAYHRSHPSATTGVTNSNWTVGAGRWAVAVSLNAGITDNQASNARLLSQLMPTARSLDPNQPSVAEALAVQAGCTILNPALDSPFIHFWNYSSLSQFDAPQPQYQAFNASVRSQEFSSGGTQQWQGVFYFVLVAIFLTNAFCLGYLLSHNGLVTDIMEPQNLFALSLNSPPSEALDGCCGGGPEMKQLATSWYIDLDRPRDHFYFRSMDEPSPQKTKRRRLRRRTWEMQLEGSPVADMYDKLSAKGKSLL